MVYIIFIIDLVISRVLLMIFLGIRCVCEGNLRGSYIKLFVLLRFLFSVLFMIIKGYF